MSHATVLCLPSITPKGEELEIRYEQVSSQHERHELPVEVARGLHGPKYFIRASNGMVVPISEGDYVVKVGKAPLIAMNPDSFKVFLDTLQRDLEHTSMDEEG